ncbi:MAG: ankyrin repeat domain-containing protein [Gammaproteobacteria bacterium]
MTDNKNDQTLVRKAVMSGDADEVKRLIAGGADVGGKDDKGWTPLHHAAQSRRIDIALALIQGGAHLQVDSRTGDGRTPLQIAVERYGEGSAIALFLLGANKIRVKNMLRPLE